MKAMFLAAAVVAATTGIAAASPEFCTVADPTGTPLNVRAQPAGEIIWTLPNGYQVRPQDTYRDKEGKLWMFVSDVTDGDPIGWVFRKYLYCV